MSLATGLQSYFKFDNNGLDKSGKARDLTYFGTTTYGAGKFNQGYALVGNPADFAQGSNSTDLDFAGPGAQYAISLWVNLNSNGSQILCEKIDATISFGWSLYRDVIDGISFQFAAAAGISTPGNIFPPGSYSHVVVNSDGATLRIYINGTQFASTSTPTIITNTDPLLIGERIGPGWTVPLDGTLDELAIWNRGLTPGEIAQLYNGGAGYEIPVGTGVGPRPKQLNINEPLPLAIYTVATLPSAGLYLNGERVFVRDESGGSIPAFSDGTNWRRVSDRAVVS